MSTFTIRPKSISQRTPAAGGSTAQNWNWWDSGVATDAQLVAAVLAASTHDPNIAIQEWIEAVTGNAGEGLGADFTLRFDSNTAAIETSDHGTVSFAALPAGFKPLSAKVVCRVANFGSTHTSGYFKLTLDSFRVSANLLSTVDALPSITGSDPLSGVTNVELAYDFTSPFEPSMLDILNNGFGIIHNWDNGTNTPARGPVLIDQIWIEGTYTIDATYLSPDSAGPQLRVYDGYKDQIVKRFPSAKAIVSVLPANGQLFLSTYDSGSTSGADVLGSVYQFTPSTNALTKLGAQFPTNHLPYSLCWAYGRLWCGTAINTLAEASGGKLYYFRPGIDTAWTLDRTFDTGEAIVSGVTLFKGELYCAVLNSGTGSGTARVYKRTTAGAFSTSDSGSIGSNSGAARGYFAVTTWPPEHGVLQTPTPTLFAIRKGIGAESGYVVRRWNTDTSLWETVYSGGSAGADFATTYSFNTATGQVVPVLWVCNGGANILNSIDGQTFTSRAGNLTNKTGMIGGIFVQAQ